MQTYSDQERNAMRAYLQRCEVRLSTLHRIGIAFISGAGLLLLIPVFFKDAIDSIISLLLAQDTNQFPALDGSLGGTLLTILLYVTVLYPLALSLIIPLYGLYLLLKDLVHFYYTIYAPDFPNTLVNPTFALTGVAFSMDESEHVKREVMRYQYMPNHMDFMLPFSEERRHEYFDTLIENTQGDIIPASRHLDYLDAIGVMPEVATEADKHKVAHFNAALGIARSIDRSLVQEVAITEMAITRSILYLRRLMLRYVKTLLMFIWTILIAFTLLPLLKDPDFPLFVVLGVGYGIWAVGVMPIMKLPIGWIYRHRYGKIDPKQIDSQLTLMETDIQPFSNLAILSSVIGLILAVVASFS
ncbi:MAG: hypothetical protein H6673_15915 [Anaerolineales bacterium]|nr:hypothetical protein [Anaerolineales bacterium]